MKNMSLALSVGFLCVIWVTFALSVGSIGGLTIYPWVVFITWPLFFAAGANNEAVVKVATTAVWGPVFGWISVFGGVTLLGPIIGVPLGLGILVGVLAWAVVIMMTDIPFFSFGPGAFACWATFFATGNDFVGSIVILLVGVGLGWLSVKIPSLFAKKEVAKKQGNTEKI